MVALLVLATILVFLTIDYFVQRRRLHAVPEPALDGNIEVLPLFVKANLRAPAGVFFSPDHTWLYLEESGGAKVGVSDFARSLLGEIDEVKTLSPGESVNRGDTLLRLRHGARAAIFRSPIDGVIETVNTKPWDGEDVFTADTYTSSWFYRIRPRNLSGVPEGLMIGEKAKEWLEHELERLRVFLVTIAPENRLVGQTLPDGGVPRWGLVDSIGPTDWDKLQEKFFSLTDEPRGSGGCDQ